MTDPTPNINLDISVEDDVQEPRRFVRPANIPNTERKKNETTESDAIRQPAVSLPNEGRFWRRTKRRCPMPPTSSTVSSDGDCESGMMSPCGQRKGQKKQKEVEKEIEDEAHRLEANRVVRGQITGEECNTLTAVALKNQVLDDIGMILNVSAKSRNLKGTFQRALKDAAASIKAAVEALHGRSITEETAKLQAENARLQTELAEIRKEMAELREEVTRVNKSNTPQPTQQHKKRREERAPLSAPQTKNAEDEEFIRSIMLQVGGMLDAKLEAIEDRLLPEKRTRPPLAADRRNAAAEVATHSQLQKTVERVVEGTKGTKGQKKKKASKVPQSTTREVPTSGPQQTPEVMETGWTTVVRRGGKTKTVASPQTTGNSDSTAKRTSVMPQRKAARVKLRPPKSAAVVISLQPTAEEQGVSYASVLAKAREAIDLSACGITGLKFKTAATGARILEVPGEASGEKADCLATKLKELLGEGVAKVSRPVKRTDLRISGLDDSIAPAEVIAAVAQCGGCSNETVQVGEIRKSSRGAGSIWVRCPVAAAKKIGEGGTIRIGWVSAKVELLPPRIMRCYRCLQPGHVRAQCTAETDRSADCYRCSKSGHKAKDCSAEPNCSLCASANRPAEHRLGSKACSPPKIKKGSRTVLKNTALQGEVANSGPITVAGAEEAMAIL